MKPDQITLVAEVLNEAICFLRVSGVAEGTIRATVRCAIRRMCFHEATEADVEAVCNRCILPDLFTEFKLL
jgi:hypothetical protein